VPDAPKTSTYTRAKQPSTNACPHSFAARAEKEKGRAQLEARSNASGGWTDKRAQKAAARVSCESRHVGHGQHMTNTYHRDDHEEKVEKGMQNTACQNTPVIKPDHLLLGSIRGGDTGNPPEFASKGAGPTAHRSCHNISQQVLATPRSKYYAIWESLTVFSPEGEEVPAGIETVPAYKAIREVVYSHGGIPALASNISGPDGQEAVTPEYLRDITKRVAYVFSQQEARGQGTLRLGGYEQAVQCLLTWSAQDLIRSRLISLFHEACLQTTKAIGQAQLCEPPARSARCSPYRPKPLPDGRGDNRGNDPRHRARELTLPSRAPSAPPYVESGTPYSAPKDGGQYAASCLIALSPHGKITHCAQSNR